MSKSWSHFQGKYKLQKKSLTSHKKVMNKSGTGQGHVQITNNWLTSYDQVEATKW